jgi:hypothetical protein
VSKKTINKLDLKFYFFIALYIVFIFILLKNYTGGDQVVYGNFYTYIKGKSYIHSIYNSFFSITAFEPIFIFSYWLFSNLGIEKIIYSTILNIILIIGIVKVIKKYEISYLIGLLLLCNFYLLVLLTAAERLKLSYIFIVYSLLVNRRYQILFYLFAILSHFQNIILFLGLYAYNIIVFRDKKYFIKKNYLFLFLVIVCCFIIFLIKADYFLYDLNLIKYILAKVPRETQPFNSIFKVLLLNIVLCFILKKKIIRIQFLFLVYIIFILILGNYRVNMIAVTAALGILLIEKKINHPLSVLLLLYFSLSSIPFIISIFISNHGFDYLLW